MSKQNSNLGLTVAKGCSLVVLAAALAACGSSSTSSGSTGSTSSGSTGSTSSGSTSGSTGSTTSGSTSSTSSGSTSSTSSGSSSGGNKTPFAHSDNVFAEVDNWYVNEWWSKNAEAEGGSGIAHFNTGVWMDRIAAIEDIPAGEIPNVPGLEDGQGPNEGFGLREHLQAAEDQGNALFHFVSYDLPGRDCAAVASNGELPASEYGMEVYTEHYVDRIYNILAEFPNIPVVVIIEIDSLPNLVTNAADAPCQEVNNTTSYGYTNGVRYSINKYSQLDNVHIYVDAGHSGWLGWDDDLELASLFMYGVLEGFSDSLQADAKSLASEIEGADGATGKYTDVEDTFKEPPSFSGGGTDAPGFDKIDGFITNTSNYTPLEEPYLGDPEAGEPDGPLKSAYFYDWNPRFGEWTFTEDWMDALKGHGADTSKIGMVIDTGRNGWGQSMTSISGSTEDPEQVDDYRIDKRAHRGNWCNQVDAGVGKRPQANPDGKSWIDAYIWTKPQGEADGISDPNFTPDPNDLNKKHDPMCDPDELSTHGQNADSTKDLNLGTSAMPDAPHAGRWFSEQFQMLYDNAYPAIGDGKGDK